MIIDIICINDGYFQGLKKHIENKTQDVNVNINILSDYLCDGEKLYNDEIGGDLEVLSVKLVSRCLDEIRNTSSTVVMLTDDGYSFSNDLASTMFTIEHLILIVLPDNTAYDERIRSYVDFELKLNTGVGVSNELSALIMLDYITKDLLIDSKAPKDTLTTKGDWLLNPPVYTNPIEFNNEVVPEVLQGTDKDLINKFKVRESVRRTYLNRPDLLESRSLTIEEQFHLEVIIDEEDKQ